MRVKTGECYYRDEFGCLWLAESYLETEDGTVTTQDVEVEEMDHDKQEVA